MGGMVSNTNRNWQNGTRFRDPMINDFVQDVFTNNQELGFLPFRLDNSGFPVANKAYMKKATPQTLLFDVEEKSFKLTKNPKNKDILSLNFQVDCLVPTIIEIFHAAVEKRSNDSNVVEEIISMEKPESQLFYLEKGLEQQLPRGQCLVSLKRLKKGGLKLEDSYSPLIVKLSEKKQKGSYKQNEQTLYVYLSVEIKGEDIRPVFEKKGVQFNNRFLWTKSVYDYSQGNGSYDCNTHCSICYENKINTLMIPCRHMVLCHSCANELKNRFQK